jgi:hypothetical protein
MACREHGFIGDGRAIVCDGSKLEGLTLCFILVVDHSARQQLIRQSPDRAEEGQALADRALLLSIVELQLRVDISSDEIVATDLAMLAAEVTCGTMVLGIRGTMLETMLAVSKPSGIPNSAQVVARPIIEPVGHAFAMCCICE